MKVGLHLPQLGRAASPNRVMRVAQTAEQLGFDDVWASDHIAVPMSLSGLPAFFPEPIPLLSLAAAVTERIGLGSSVIVPAYRNPMQFAKQWATLDWTAPGRTILGVGAGWLREEFEACQLEMRDRGRRLDDYIRGFRVLWSGGTSFESEFFAFHDVQVKPQPASPVPIWIGGSSPGALARVAWWRRLARHLGTARRLRRSSVPAVPHIAASPATTRRGDDFDPHGGDPRR